jgi:hypothetical protein
LERPPVAKAGEIVMQHVSGATFKFAKDGSVTLSANGHDISINAGGGNVTING